MFNVSTVVRNKVTKKMPEKQLRRTTLATRESNSTRQLLPPLPSSSDTQSVTCFGAYLYSAGTQYGNLHPAGWPILCCIWFHAWSDEKSHRALNPSRSVSSSSAINPYGRDRSSARDDLAVTIVSLRDQPTELYDNLSGPTSPLCKGEMMQVGLLPRVAFGRVQFQHKGAHGNAELAL